MALTTAANVPLIDHHCHGIVDGPLSSTEFRALGSESEWEGPAGTDSLDSPFGFALRAICGPQLGLEPHVPLDEYIEARRELGSNEVNRRLLGGTGTSTYLIDTGITTTKLLTPSEMSTAADARTEEIVRIESIAELFARQSTAQEFVGNFGETLSVRARNAVGLKSILAYRHGFDISAERPQYRDVLKAASSWLRESEASGIYRLTDPVLLRFGLWAGIDTGLPIQLHTGYGDGDVELFRADPSRLTPLFHATRTSGVKFMLLHCYPYIREAGILAQVFPHVYLDVGLVSHYLGPSAGQSIRQAMEIAPFSKVLYSSDAFGLPEHYAVSAHIWRREFSALMQAWVSSEWTSEHDARRITDMVAFGNARRVYGLTDVTAEDGSELSLPRNTTFSHR